MTVRIFADSENNAELFWGRMDRNFPDIAEAIRRDGSTLVTDQQWIEIKQLLGFNHGPKHATEAVRMKPFSHSDLDEATLDQLTDELAAAGWESGQSTEDDARKAVRKLLSETFAKFEALAEFNHQLTTLGFELVDLPLPVGVETEIFLTEGGLTPNGRIYGVFDSPWHAQQSNADERAICTLGSGSLPPVLQELGERNSERLTGAIECMYSTDSESGSVVAATWKHACDWLSEQIPSDAISNGAWGWIESPNDDEGRFYVAKHNMD
jgi:hypothetical protein